VKLFLKISNLCDHDTSTSRTDGQTDRRLVVLVHDNNALCVASRGKNDVIPLGCLSRTFDFVLKTPCAQYLTALD